MQDSDSVELLHYACIHPPSLVIDCSGSANPHKLFPAIQPEQLFDVYVIQCELLYVFRDILKKLPEILKQHDISTIVVTRFNHLFHYNSEQENKDIIEHVWVLLSKLALRHTVIVGNYDPKYCQPWAIQSQASGLS
jgi:hypothetical protein